jgi:hypothetical protein
MAKRGEDDDEAQVQRWQSASVERRQHSPWLHMEIFSLGGGAALYHIWQ